MMNATLGAMVSSRPSLAPVLESLGLDYCCGGHRTLDEAARERGLDPHTVAAVLAALPDLAPAPAANPALLETGALVDHIVATHHAYVRRELPRLIGWSAKVLGAHGAHHPELAEVNAEVQRLSEALLEHLEREERELFPALKTPTGTSADRRRSLAVYIEEHEEAGGLLARLRELTGGFVTPPDGCTTYRTFLAALGAFEADLHQHVHLENNVLFSRL